MNKPVNFELAKLLKKKEFPQPKTTFEAQKLGLEFNWYNEDGIYNANFKLDTTIQAPTIADVVMWLYEIYDIWIQTPFSHNDIKPFCWVISKTLRNISEEEENKNCWLSGIDNDNTQGYDSPTEAAESAIEYTLNNLI